MVAPIHNRMPVIPPREAYDRWLDPTEVPSGALDDLLVAAALPGRAAGVVAYSSGNHALGVATAARLGVTRSTVYRLVKSYGLADAGGA